MYSHDRDDDIKNFMINQVSLVVASDGETFIISQVNLTNIQNNVSVSSETRNIQGILSSYFILHTKRYICLILLSARCFASLRIYDHTSS